MTKSAYHADPEFTTCPWLVQRPSGNPEPDSPSDLWVEEECGAPGVEINGYGSWRAQCGHHYVAMEDPQRYVPGGYEDECKAAERVLD